MRFRCVYNISIHVKTIYKPNYSLQWWCLDEKKALRFWQKSHGASVVVVASEFSCVFCCLKSLFEESFFTINHFADIFKNFLISSEGGHDDNDNNNKEEEEEIIVAGKSMKLSPEISGNDAKKIIILMLTRKRLLP